MSDWVWTYTSPSGPEVQWGTGTMIYPHKLTGLDGFDQVRNSTVDIPRGHGGIPGQHYLPPRQPVFDCRVASDDMTAVREQAMKALAPSISTDGTLVWKRLGEATRLLYCRPVSVVWPMGQAYQFAEVKLAFEASDPRMYAGVGRTTTLQPFAASGGVNSPVDDVKDADVSGLEKTAQNDGNAGSPPVIRFYGPSSGTCTGVQLANRTTGVTVDVQTSITAGQILTVDMRALVAATGSRVVDLSGAARYGDWQQPREPLLIGPGSNVLRFTADGDTSDMQCVVSWRDAWIS